MCFFKKKDAFFIARAFATASRATASAGSRRMAMATAGVVTASALSYAYLQSMSYYLIRDSILNFNETL